MKGGVAFVALLAARSGLAQQPVRKDLTYNKTESLEPKFFKDLGSKRVKITYGPFHMRGIDDAQSHGMISFTSQTARMPCQECLITGYVVDLLLENGTVANANNGMWLHHIGLMNLNRNDAACDDYPDRITVNGNERTPIDLTLAGTRKVGYYLRRNESVSMVADIMNEADFDRTVFLTMEFEYLEGTPEGFQVAIPVWMDVKGACLNQSTGVGPENTVFHATSKPGWSPSFSGDLFLAVGHVHDGSTKQELFIDGKKVCTNNPRYAESPGFITHVGTYGHGKNKTTTTDPGHEHEHEPEHHDHGSGDHIAHLSSVTHCKNLGMVGPANTFTLTSYYNLTMHPGMESHDGGLEPIMGIEYLFIARPKDEAVTSWDSSKKKPDMNKFLNRGQPAAARP